MKLTKEEIENIIVYEIVVDCYSEEEANMGWAIYLDENIFYPFDAEYLVRKKSGEKEWKKVSVVLNETEEFNFDGEHYYVEIEIDDIIISAEINELRNIEADETTMKTLQIWSYRNKY